MLLWRFSLFFVTCHLRQNPLLFYLITWHGVLHIEAVEAAATFARHYGSTGADIGAEADVVNDISELRVVELKSHYRQWLPCNEAQSQT